MPTNFLGTVRSKLFDGKTWYPPSHPENCFKSKIYSKTVGLPSESFRHCEIHKFWLKIVICPLLYIIFFKTRFFPEKQKVSFTKLFVSVLWDKKKSTKRWKYFDTRILSKGRSVLLRISSSLSEKNLSTEFGHKPFLCIRFQETRFFLKHRSVPQRKFLVLWDKKNRTKIVVPPFLHKILKALVEMFVENFRELDFEQ